MKCRKQRQPAIYWKTKQKNSQKRWLRKVKEIAGGNAMHHSPLTTSSSTRQIFATLDADRKSWFTTTDISTGRRQLIGANSIDFHCSVGRAFSHRWKYIQKKRSREIQIRALVASVKIQVVESLFSPRRNLWINSSSINQRYWLLEIVLAASIGDLDHSGFVFDRHQLDFETLASKIAKGVMKIIPADFKRKTNFLDETQYKNKCPMLTGRQIMYHIFSFFNIKKTQGYIMMSSCTMTTPRCSITRRK